MHYFVGTLHHGLHVWSRLEITVIALSDVDWGSNPYDKKQQLVTVY